MASVVCQITGNSNIIPQISMLTTEKISTLHIFVTVDSLKDQ